MAKKKYYAVKKGFRLGIYESWPSAERQVKGYSGAKFKGFSSRTEAQAWLEDDTYQEKKRDSTISRKRGRGATDCHGARTVIYTDGGAINNPGPGGYGVVIQTGEEERELSGGYRLTTNNRMELMACIVALEHIARDSGKIVLFSDSSYVVNGFSKGWVKKWKRNGWLKSDRKPVVNQDLWERLYSLQAKLDIDFRWVKGHAGNPLNERCDQLAVASARSSGLPVDQGYEED